MAIMEMSMMFNGIKHLSIHYDACMPACELIMNMHTRAAAIWSFAQYQHTYLFDIFQYIPRMPWGAGAWWGIMPLRDEQ